MNGSPLLGAIEAGGTKFVLAIGSAPDDIIARHEIQTHGPGITLAQAADWFEGQRSSGELAALGIASFGPVELNRGSNRWGHITNTPKPGWADCDIAGYFAKRLQVPIGFDTDVNGAALAEFRFGAGETSASLAYITVGTGIGGGLVIDGAPVHGASHPEMGHIFPRRHSDDSEFVGICPHHRDCLEGLACGPAIKARWGASLSELPSEHPAHTIIADYIAQLVNTLIATTSVETVVLGGGVMKTDGLLARVRLRAAELGADYFPGDVERSILAPALGDNAGLTGALVLAQSARV